MRYLNPTLRGRVVDVGTGEPVPNAPVSLKLGARTYEYSTRADGRFLIRPIRKRQYVAGIMLLPYEPFVSGRLQVGDARKQVDVGPTEWLFWAHANFNKEQDFGDIPVYSINTPR